MSPTKKRDIGDDSIVFTLATVIHRGLTQQELDELDPKGVLRDKLKIGDEFDGTRGQFSTNRASTTDSRYKSSIALDDKDAGMTRVPIDDVEIPLHMVPGLQAVVESKGHVIGDLFMEREANSMLQNLSTALATATGTPTATPS